MVILLSIVFVAFSTSKSVANIRQGEKVHEFVGVIDSNNKPVKLKPFKDQVVVVTFGASWCAPCKKELPTLEKLAAKYAAGKKVVVIAVNIDNEQAKGAAFMKAAGLDHVISAFDSKKSTVGLFDPPSMPSTFIIRQGIVRHVHSGYRKGDDKKLDKLITAEVAKL